jgi:hypothetical protein
VTAFAWWHLKKRMKKRKKKRYGMWHSGKHE